MRLYELVTTKTHHNITYQPFDYTELNKIDDQQVDQDISTTGRTARGGEDTQDPHMYNKTYRWPVRLAEDAYQAYITAIQPYVDSNPFFPRVYVTNIQTGPDNMSLPRYKLEKLHRGSDFDPEALVALGKSLFPDFAKHSFALLQMDMRHASDNDELSQQLWHDIVKCVDRMLRPTRPVETNNPQLQQAMELIKGLIYGSEGRFSNDIHDDNVMIRTGRTGLQLVITDPISN